MDKNGAKNAKMEALDPSWDLSSGRV